MKRQLTIGAMLLTISTGAFAMDKEQPSLYTLCKDAEISLCRVKNGIISILFYSDNDPKNGYIYSGNYNESNQEVEISELVYDSDDDMVNGGAAGSGPIKYTRFPSMKSQKNA